MEAGLSRRGRPRDPATDSAILTSTLAVLGERGVTGTTVDAVAEQAGVAKTTIYRRYRDRGGSCRGTRTWS